MAHRLWTEDEMILALSVYFQLPFGRLNHTTPEVRELGRLIGRTENSAAFRLVNFAACDPYIINSGRHGMSGGEKVCQPVWDAWAHRKEELFEKAAEIRARLENQSVEKLYLQHEDKDLVGQERVAMVKQRVNQSAFRTMIMYNYENTCAITGINIPQLLVASHIIPWAEREETRLIPENGICLSSLYDKAFDQGLITISPDDYTIQLSSALMEYHSESYYNEHFGSKENTKILLPIEHLPNRDYLAYHREHIFLGA